MKAVDDRSHLIGLAQVDVANVPIPKSKQQIDICEAFVRAQILSETNRDGRAPRLLAHCFVCVEMHGRHRCRLANIKH